jgi:putative lipase involved disintegration of autophagic bodies
MQQITHVYHTADPVPMGTCNGVSSACAIGGFAFESSCHMGKIVKYDTVTKLKWSVGLSNHPIKYVIENVLDKDWDPDNGISVPEPEEQVDCVVCSEPHQLTKV